MSHRDTPVSGVYPVGMRALLALALVLVVVPALPSSVAAAAGNRPDPRRCSGLAGRDLLPRDPAIRLVRVRTTRVDRATGRRLARSRYRICATPDGKVRTAAEVGEAVGRRTTLSLGVTRGTRVVLKVAGAGSDGSYDLTWTLVDARTGRRTPVWGFDSTAADNPLPEPSQMVVEPGGRFGLLFRTTDGPGAWSGFPAGTDTLVAGYGRDGVRHDLDAAAAPAIGARALRLAGSILVWMNGDERRSQDLATLG